MAIIAKQSNQLKWIRASLWLAAISLGAVHTWAAAFSYSMNPDGICYLDMGDAFFRGDWHMAVNAYWSPFYSWILGLSMNIIKPSMKWEIPLVHLVNFFIYLVTLVCFEFFWRQLSEYRREKKLNVSESKKVFLPEWSWLVLGYSLFIWTALSLINIWAVTPDMCVAAIVYLSAGLMLRIRRGSVTWQTYVLLGFVLGIGYLAKAVMFPLGFVFLAVSVFVAGDIRRALPLAAAALAVFLLIGAPLIATLSAAKDRPTFGDSGKLMYAWYVNGIPFSHWQGKISGGGTPEHPTRKIFDDPPIFEFREPLGGTYPVSYDPSYWYEGVIARFDWRGQIKVLISGVQYYFNLFFRQQGGLIVCALIMYLMSKPRRIQLNQLMRNWGLAIIAVIAFGLYAVVHVQPRYIGAFVVLLWANILVEARMPKFRESKKLVTLFSLGMILFPVVNIAAFNLEGLNAITFNVNAFQGGSSSKSVGGKYRSPRWPGEVAEQLHQLGVQPGDDVAVIGYAFESYWARLARVKIVAEMFGWEADPFWRGSPSFQSKVIDAFKSSGAKAIVAEDVPGYARLNGWQQINDTSYHVYLLGSN